MICCDCVCLLYAFLCIFLLSHLCVSRIFLFFLCGEGKRETDIRRQQAEREGEGVGFCTEEGGGEEETETKRKGWGRQ